MNIKQEIEKQECREINIVNIESNTQQFIYTYEFINSPGSNYIAYINK